MSERVSEGWKEVWEKRDKKKDKGETRENENKWQAGFRHRAETYKTFRCCVSRGVVGGKGRGGGGGCGSDRDQARPES